MLDNLPKEVIEEILYRLPTKCLLKCTSVCKSWYALIKSPNFIFTLLHKTLISSNNNNRLFLLHRLISGSQYPLHFDNEKFEEYMPLHFPSNFLSIAGSCNGLLCLFHNPFTCGIHDFKLILWNPFIRKTLALPQSNFSFTYPHRYVPYVISIGFDYVTNDYKVLRVFAYTPQSDTEHGTQFKAEVYSLNANSWKDISDIVPKYEIDSAYVIPTFVNGALHWVARDLRNPNARRSLIIVFDVKDEVFREILLPECLSKFHATYLSIKVFGKSSIAVIYRDFFYRSDIWVMREYGVMESWMKLATIGKRSTGTSKVLGFRNNGEVLVGFARGSKLSSYDPKSKQIKNIIPLGSHLSSFSCYIYVESLALLDKGNDAGAATGPSEAKQTKTCN